MNYKMNHEMTLAMLRIELKKKDENYDSIASGSDLSKHWIAKFNQEKYDYPRGDLIDKLYEYLKSRHLFKGKKQ